MHRLLLAVVAAALVWAVGSPATAETPKAGGSVVTTFKDDLPIIMGVTLVAAVAIVLGNLLADLVTPLIDPRIRLR